MGSWDVPKNSPEISAGDLVCRSPTTIHCLWNTSVSKTKFCHLAKVFAWIRGQTGKSQGFSEQPSPGGARRRTREVVISVNDNLEDCLRCLGGPTPGWRLLDASLVTKQWSGVCFYSYKCTSEWTHSSTLSHGISVCFLYGNNVIAGF